MNRTQSTLAGTRFDKYTKTTRRAQFLAEMDRVVPWRELCARIEPVCPKAGNGRPPVGVGRMLRMYFLQHRFNLSDPAVEEALYDSPTMRAFVGIDLGREPVPDETTVCKFRHLLEQHGLGQEHRQDKGGDRTAIIGSGGGNWRSWRVRHRDVSHGWGDTVASIPP